MKTFSVAAALAAAATTVFALPSPTQELEARASSGLTAITVKGNGTTAGSTNSNWTNSI